MIIDTTKAEFIKDRFAGSKIGIFYVFKEEYKLLQQVFGEDNLTNDLNEFNTTDKNIALQIVSGREGISLRNADFLVFYNIQHSAVSYFQGIDRMTTIDRLENKVYWIFTEGGIEEKIYKVVKSKKKYTNNIFKKDYELTR
jgi:ERCC4-related helicase